MSEYWVSHKRYQCKYCNIYIADDKPSRQQHENGLRHKGNVERFVRGLYKEGEKRTREREEEKGIMASVGKAAEAAYALDVASGRAGTSSSGGLARPESVTKAKPKPKPSDPYANYSTPASLGYKDPDLEDQSQRGTGEPSAWTVVSTVEKVEEQTEEKVEEEEKVRGKKRETEETEEDGGRTFKLRRKTLDVGLGEMYDPSRPDGKGEPTEATLFRKRRGRIVRGM